MSSGECVAEAEILFASPTGPDAGTCPKTQPCSIAHASAVADQTRNTIKLAPGAYTAHIILTTKTLAIHGVGATISNQGADPVFEVEDGGRLRLVGPAISATSGSVGAVRCEASTSTPPVLELFRTTLDNNSTVVLGNPCMLTVEESVVRSTSTSAYLLVLVAPTVAKINRTRLVGGSGVAGLNNPSVQIANSVFKNVGDSSANPTFAGGTFEVSFSTIVNSIVKCGTGGASALTLNSSIVTNTTAGAPADTVQGTCTSVKHTVASPQSSPLGATNVTGMPPQLKNAGADDYHLLSSSPAIDRGDPASTNAVDFEGTPRPQGSGRDSGAFEYKP